MWDYCVKLASLSHHSVLIPASDSMFQKSINKSWLTLLMTAHFSQGWAPFYLLFMEQLVFLHRCKLLLMSLQWFIWKGCLFLLLLHIILAVVLSGSSWWWDFDHSPTADTNWSKQKLQKLLNSVVGVCSADFPFHVLQPNWNCAE